MKKRSLKHFFIMPSYQIRLTAFMCLVIFIGFILHGCLLYYIAGKNIQNGFFAGANEMRQVWDILKPAVIVTNGVSFIVMSVFMFLVAIFISHKLAGPILKISGHLKKIASGKLPSSTLKLREHDEGQLLCDTVNELQTGYRATFLSIKQVADSMNAQDPAKTKLDEILSEIEFE